MGHHAADQHSGSLARTCAPVKQTFCQHGISIGAKQFVRIEGIRQDAFGLEGVIERWSRDVSRLYTRQTL